MTSITELACPLTGAGRHKLAQSEALKFWTNSHVSSFSLSGHDFQIIGWLIAMNGLETLLSQLIHS